MSPTDKGGSTPESPETPDLPGDPTPDETTPSEPVTGETTPSEPVAGEPATSEPGPAEGFPAPTAPPAPAADLGAGYPAPEAFGVSAEAAKKSNKKVLTIVGAAVIAVVAVVAAVLAVLFTGDDPVDPEAQIKAVTEEYIAYMNTGTASKLPEVLCSDLIAQLPSPLEDQAAQPIQAQIDSFDEIKIDGDKATSKFTISAIDNEDIPAETLPMSYVNENGWKLCQ